MDASKHLKKTACDMHPADVIASLRKRGWSLRQLSLTNGYAPGMLKLVFQRKTYRKAEQIIADALGVHPKDIWPSRYDKNGISLAPPMGRPRIHDWSKASTSAKARKTQSAATV